MYEIAKFTYFPPIEYENNKFISIEEVKFNPFFIYNFVKPIKKNPLDFS